MSSLNAVFDIAKSALMATQKAMNVTSHNVSNANTEGYTRQRAVLSTNSPVNFGGLYFGTGVSVSGIQRVYDSFQTIQLRSSISLLSRHETAGQHLSALEAILNDFDGSGLSSRLDAFFNSFEDIAASPSSYGERSALLASANVLADTVNSIDSSLRVRINNINSGIEAKITEINSLASQVAELNLRISSSELAGVSANDLRDTRDLVLEDMARHVDVSVTENAMGQTDVFLGGSFIVAGNKASVMSYEMDTDDPGAYDIVLNGATVNDRISGGGIRGDLDGLAYSEGVHARVNLIAASLVKEVNLQHSGGYGLDGSTGTDFFAPLSVNARAFSSNPGGAVVSGGAVTDLSLLTLDDYEIRFSGPASYNVVNAGTNTIVSSGAYASGSPIAFDGLSVTITDGPLSPAAGDKFLISVRENAARGISVAVIDPDKVAASSTAAGVPGDNTNAQALADLRDAALVDGASFSRFYSRMVTDLGTETNGAKLNSGAQKMYTDELRAVKEATSGVSIEEEAINLVKLQRAYEAAAKVMSTVDKMLETLLSLR